MINIAHRLHLNNWSQKEIVLSKPLTFGIVFTLEDISYPGEEWKNFVLQEEIRPPEQECFDGRVLYSSKVKITNEDIDMEFYAWLKSMDEIFNDKKRVLQLLSVFMQKGFEHGIKYKERQNQSSP